MERRNLKTGDQLKIGLIPGYGEIDVHPSGAVILRTPEAIDLAKQYMEEHSGSIAGPTWTVDGETIMPTAHYSPSNSTIGAAQDVSRILNEQLAALNEGR